MRQKAETVGTFELLGEMIRPPEAVREKRALKPWEPNLKPAEKKAWDSEARALLCWGEKLSGKSWLLGMKVLKHCYDNQNALGLILVRVQNMATKGGAWDKLLNEIIPMWKEQIGLVTSEIKTDNQHYQYIWVLNRFNTWSMIAVMSSPHANQLRSRIRGVEPSCVFVDELTSCDSPLYFQSIFAQLGRRPFVTGVQQYLAACNPEGPSHWVHNKWFVEPFNEETGEWDPDFENIHFLREEIADVVQPGAFDQLEKAYRGDAIEKMRMVGGQWVDRPSGESHFVDLFNPRIHVRPIDEDGTPDKAHRIMPIKGYPIIVSVDPGPMNSAFILEQWLPVDGRQKWITFDEVVVLKKRIDYRQIIRIVMKKIRWWRDTCGCDEKGEQLKQVWISDESAFSQWRAGGGGSFDVMEFEKIYESYRAEFKLESMKVRQAPKFQGSVKARIQTVQTLLVQDEIIVSSCCPHVQRMFLQLRAPKQKEGQPFDPDVAMSLDPKDPNRHIFDAYSYDKLTAAIRPLLLQPPQTGTQKLFSVAA